MFPASYTEPSIGLTTKKDIRRNVLASQHNYLHTIAQQEHSTHSTHTHTHTHTLTYLPENVTFVSVLPCSAKRNPNNSVS